MADTSEATDWMSLDDAVVNLLDKDADSTDILNRVETVIVDWETGEEG